MFRVAGKGTSRAASRRTMALAILVVLVAGSVLSVEYVQARAKDPIKIGVILSLTGSGASSTVDARDALVIAVEEINQRNELNGRKIVLIIRDCMSDPDKAVEVYGEIEEAHHPLMYISGMSSISVALAPLAENNRTPLIAVVSSSDSVTAGREWVFRYYPGSVQETVPVLAKIDALGISTVGFLYLDDEYGNSVLDAFQPEIQSRGLSLKTEHFQPGATDYSAQIQNLSDAEAIFAVGVVGNYQGILAQLRGADYSGLVFVASGASVPSVRSIPEADGVFVSAPNIYRPAYAFSKHLEEEFEERHNKPLTHQGASTYDVLQLVSGLLVDEVVSKENLRDLLLRGFVYSGTLGDIIAKPGTHNFAFPLYQAQVVNGVLVFR